MLRLEAKVQRVEVVHSGPELVAEYAQLRADCEAAGHALGQKAHTATAGSPPPRSAWGFRLSRTTGSSGDVPGLDPETLASG